jgi:exodeoxyribonuclease VII large subunit
LHQQGVERAASVLHRSIGRLQQRIDELEYRMRERTGAAAAARRQRLDELFARLRSLDLRLRISAARRRLEAADAARTQLVRLRLTRAHGGLDPLIAHLTQLSPLKILERGYALVTNEAGQIVKAPADAPVGSEIGVRLAKGGIAARVIER